MPLLVDTGVLYALADADDRWHRAVRDYIEACGEILVVPVTVLPEVAYLLHGRLGSFAEERFVASLVAGEMSVEGLGRADLRRAAEVMASYPDVGFVDATIVAMAERLRLETIATTDRRHFAAFVPRHVDAFALVPEPP